MAEVINGTDVHIFVSTDTNTWKYVAHATSHTLSINNETRDTSNKATGGYKTKAYGRKDVTGTLDGMIMEDGTLNYSDFMGYIVNSTPVYMYFGGNNGNGTGDPNTSTVGGVVFYASGKFIISKCDATYPDMQNSTFSVSFEHYEGFRINELYVS